MTKKEIKILAQKSFSRNELNTKKVKNFAKKMNRHELRNYIRFLKELDSKKKIIIFLPSLEKIKALLIHQNSGKIMYIGFIRSQMDYI